MKQYIAFNIRINQQNPYYLLSLKQLGIRKKDITDISETKILIYTYPKYEQQIQETLWQETETIEE